MLVRGGFRAPGPCLGGRGWLLAEGGSMGVWRAPSSLTQGDEGSNPGSSTCWLVVTATLLSMS